MQKTTRDFFSGTADIASVIIVCLFPVVSGAVLFRLLNMSGTPVWFLILQGLLFLGGIAQLVFLVHFGLVRASRRKGR